jgi:hypothetical protein
MLLYPKSPVVKNRSREKFESRPKGAARLVIDVSAKWASPCSRGLWVGDALPLRTGAAGKPGLGLDAPQPPRRVQLVAQMVGSVLRRPAARCGGQRSAGGGRRNGFHTSQRPRWSSNRTKCFAESPHAASIAAREGVGATHQRVRLVCLRVALTE